jgi:glycosyltransferase involved in cell wall biosynthesis
VTSSHYTKGNIVQLLGVDDARVHVVRPGAPWWSSTGRAQAPPREGYVLFLGTLEPRKNLGIVLDAYQRLLGEGRSVPPLVVAGGAGLGAQAWIERMGRPPLAAHVTYRGYVPDAEREALVRGARALVLPSWDEGFGLPALEGMAAGIPVIVSNRGALPEVVDDAGVVLPPDDADAWAGAVERIAHDDAWANDRAAAGLERARAFQWPDAADALGAAYDAAVERRRARS